MPCSDAMFAGYYGTFMNFLHRAFDGKAIISSVSSMGFHTLDSDLHKQYRTFTLQEQCKHKAAYMQQHVFTAHDLPVVVMGHSIGIYMAMQAVRQCEREATINTPKPDTVTSGISDSPQNDANRWVSSARPPHSPGCFGHCKPRISSSFGGTTMYHTFNEHVSCRVIQLIGLMPFVHTVPEHPVQKRLRFLASIRFLLGAAATILPLLPFRVKTFLAAKGGGKMDQESVDVTAALIRPDVIRVAFTLAAHEFHDLDNDATDGWADFEHFASDERYASMAVFLSTVTHCRGEC